MGTADRLIFVRCLRKLKSVWMDPHPCHGNVCWRSRHCSMCRVVHTLKTVARLRGEGCYTMGAGAHDETPGSLYRLCHMPHSLLWYARAPRPPQLKRVPTLTIFIVRIFDALNFVRLFVYKGNFTRFAVYVKFKAKIKPNSSNNLLKLNIYRVFFS